MPVVCQVGIQAGHDAPGGFAQTSLAQVLPPILQLICRLGAGGGVQALGLAHQDSGSLLVQVPGPHRCQHRRHLVDEGPGLVDQPLPGHRVTTTGERHSDPGVPIRAVMRNARAAGSGVVRAGCGQLDLPGRDGVLEPLQLLDQALLDPWRIQLSRSCIHLGAPPFHGRDRGPLGLIQKVLLIHETTV